MFKSLIKENFFDILLLPDILMFFFSLMFLLFMPELIIGVFTYTVVKILILIFLFYLLNIINKTVKNISLNKILKVILKYLAFHLNIRLIIFVLLVITANYRIG